MCRVAGHFGTLSRFKSALLNINNFHNNKLNNNNFHRFHDVSYTIVVSNSDILSLPSCCSFTN
jgi:hypothetical protein